MTTALATAEPTLDGRAPAHASHPAAAPMPLAVTRASGFAALMDNSDAVMHHGMAHALRTGDPDHDFASMMVPHHQGAVDMAKVELLYGKDPVLRRLAQEIIVTQQQEIAVMRRQLDVQQSRREPTNRKMP